MTKIYNSKLNKLGIFLYLSSLFLYSCTSTTTITNPSPSVSISPSSTISNQSPSPINSSTSTPSPQNSTVPTNLPSVSPSNAQETKPTTDISSFVSINGKVYDDTGNLLNDILITVKSLDTNNNFFAEAKTLGGSYVFRNVPVGVRLEITAYKSDKWTTRKQTYVAKSNLQGSPDQNVIDFGDFYSVTDLSKQNFYFLSDAPEVSSVTPDRSTSIKHNGMIFKLKFSEPVIKSTVEKNFAVRSLKESAPINAVIGDGTDGTFNTDGLSFSSEPTQVVLDKSSGFSYVWDTVGQITTGKEVTISLPQGVGVLTSNVKGALYGITLRDRSSGVKLTDADNNAALDAGEFLYNTVGVRAKNHVFLVEADREAPYLQELKLNKTSSKSIISLVFSEPMVVDGYPNSEWRDLSFYKFYKSASLIELDPDETEVRVSSPNILEISTTQDIFRSGDKIKAEIDLNLKDPVGNFFSQGITLSERDNIKEEIYSN